MSNLRRSRREYEEDVPVTTADAREYFLALWDRLAAGEAYARNRGLQNHLSRVGEWFERSCRHNGHAVPPSLSSLK